MTRAVSAGVKFIGVTYGWCFDNESYKQYRVPFASIPLEILLYT